MKEWNSLQWFCSEQQHSMAMYYNGIFYSFLSWYKTCVVTKKQNYFNLSCSWQTSHLVGFRKCKYSLKRIYAACETIQVLWAICVRAKTTSPGNMSQVRPPSVRLFVCLFTWDIIVSFFCWKILTSYDGFKFISDFGVFIKKVVIQFRF